MVKKRKNKTLSVVLATFNEEQNLKRCLDSVKKIAAEIIVVDGSSTDNTQKIAQQCGAIVTVTQNRAMFHTNKQMAVDQASGDWILQLDADEVVSPELAVEIKLQTQQNSKFNAYYLKRKNLFLGRWLKKGGQYPDPVIRFFKRGKAYFPQKSVHEQLQVEGEVGTLHGHLVHYLAETFSRYLTNADRYTSLTAQELVKAEMDPNPGKTVNYLFIKPLITFFSLYIRHKGFLDGFSGFVFALFSGLHFSLAYIKYWGRVKVCR